MRGVSPVVTTVLLVGITIAAAVIAFTWISSSTQSLQQSVSTVSIGTGMFSIAAARMTTPYTWEVVVTDISGRGGSLEGLRAVVKKDGKVCGVSKGFFADVNELSPYGSAKLLFYGDLDCRLDDGGEWTITVSGGAYSTEAEISPPSDVYLWIPFKSVHDMDWSGKHEVYFHSDDGPATFHGYHDGDAVGFDWDKDIVEGVKGEALKFDRTSGTYIVTETTSPLKGVRALTVCAWAYPTESGNYRCVVDSRSDGVGGGHTGVNIYLDASEYWAFWYGTGTTYSSVRAPNPIPSLNRWYFVCGRIEENNTITLFIDGTPVAQRVDSRYVELNADVPLIVGGIGQTAAGTYFFPGLIDEVRIYTRALSDEEIQALYRGEDIRDGLVLYYTFDRNTIDTGSNKVYDVHMWGPGKVNGGVYLSESNTEVISFSTPLSPEDDQTYVVWFKVENDKSGVVFSDYGGTETYIGVFETRYKACVNSICAIVNVPVVEGWHFAAVTYTEVDKDLNKGMVRFFLVLPDGNTYYVENNGSYHDPAEVSSIGLHCGHYISKCEMYATPPKIFSGEIDEFRIYNRVLSKDELRCIYENPECLINDENLVVYYTFDYPDKAWQNLPDWHRASKAPEIRTENGWKYAKFHVASYAVVDDYILYGKKQYSIVNVIYTPTTAENGSPTWPKDLYFGVEGTDVNVALWVWERNSGGTIDLFGFSFKYNCPTGSGGIGWSNLPGTWHTLAAIWDARHIKITGNGTGGEKDIPADCNTVFDVNASSTTYPERFRRLVIGASSWLGESSYNSHKAILALDRALSDLEINAICKLFGTC